MGTKISALTDGVTAIATDRIPIARSPFGSTNNNYITPLEIATYILGGTYNANIVYSSTGGPSSGPILQIGASNAGSQGWILGNSGNNFSGLWPTEVTPSTANYTVGYSNGSLFLGAATGGRIRFNNNNTLIGTFDGSGVLTLGANADTGLSYVSAATIGVGNGTAASISGTLKLANVDSGAASNLILKYNGVSTLTIGAANTPLTVAGITTGTNADFLCLSAGGVVLLQTTACTISSLRFKERVHRWNGDALSLIRKLNPIVFNMIGENEDNNYNRTQIGLAAENVAAVDSKLAIYERDGVTPKSYRQESLISVLIQAVNQLQDKLARSCRA